MKTLYLDLFSGISGDMFIGGLIDLGVDAGRLTRELEKLRLDGYHLHVARGRKSSIEGVKFDVHVESEHHHHDLHHHSDSHGHEHDQTHPSDHSHAHTHTKERTFTQIRQLITESLLSDWVKEKSLAVFQRIAVAEGKIHGLPPERVHFHEVGAVDSIVDIVGGCIGLELLDKPRVLASAVVEGVGWIDCAHGRFPLPAPATLEILAGVPLRQVAEESEFITPTGAALLAEFCERFGPMGEMRVERAGYGLGTRETPPRPNVLRAVLGQSGDPDSSETDEISQIETNLDDITPELAAAAMQRLFQAGALDVFFTPAQMKKNRPGFVLTALCHPDKTDDLARILFTETTAFGVRIHTAKRFKLRREFREVETPYGTVTIKLGFLGDDLVQASPEFESCRAAAERSGVSVRDVHLAAWIGTTPSPVA